MTRCAGPSPRRSVTAALLTAVAVVVATTAPAAAAHAPAPPRTFGVATPGAPYDVAPLAQLTSELGTRPAAVAFYVAWSTGGDFPAGAVGQVAATGATPELTWEPWDPSAGTNQPAYRLDRITAGDFDAYLSRWAQEIKAYGGPLVVRLAHEMNGNWYPWSEQVNGNGAGDYVAAWRHVVSIFRQAKVTNVTWKWSPNVPYTGSTSLRSEYPGASYVDKVALDGYNWSNLSPGSTWTSFADIFGPGIRQLRRLSTKPVYIGEVGCPEVGGDKAAWVDDMFAWLAGHPEVRGLTWFDFNKETDWRIDSSAATLAAFQRGVPGFR